MTFCSDLVSFLFLAAHISVGRPTQRTTLSTHNVAKSALARRGHPTQRLNLIISLNQHVTECHDTHFLHSGEWLSYRKDTLHFDKVRLFASAIQHAVHN